MKIEVYGMEGCHFCTMAVQLAESMMKDVTYIDASQDLQQFNKLFPNSRTVPQILVDGEWVGGYSDFEEVMESF